MGAPACVAVWPGVGFRPAEPECGAQGCTPRFTDPGLFQFLPSSSRFYGMNVSSFKMAPGSFPENSHLHFLKNSLRFYIKWSHRAPLLSSGEQSALQLCDLATSECEIVTSSPSATHLTENGCRKKTVPPKGTPAQPSSRDHCPLPALPPWQHTGLFPYPAHPNSNKCHLIYCLFLFVSFLFCIGLWTSLVAQTLKNLDLGKDQETQVRSLCQEDPPEKEMATPSTVLAWDIPKDIGAWWTTVHGVSESWMPLSNSTLTSRSINNAVSFRWTRKGLSGTHTFSLLTVCASQGHKDSPPRCILDAL